MVGRWKAVCYQYVSFKLLKTNETMFGLIWRVDGLLIAYDAISSHVEGLRIDDHGPGWPRVHRDVPNASKGFLGR